MCNWSRYQRFSAAEKKKEQILEIHRQIEYHWAYDFRLTSVLQDSYGFRRVGMLWVSTCSLHEAIRFFYLRNIRIQVVDFFLMP